MRKLFTLALAAVCLFSLGAPALAAEVTSGEVYCFTAQDFSGQEDPLLGACIATLPETNRGTVMLGTRVVQPGDIFTAQQLEEMTFRPLDTEKDAQATVGYLPIYADRVESETQMTISIRGREDKAPKAKDMDLETYKNIPNEGVLKATDPEGKPLTFTVTRQPRRGTVTLGEGGSFTYTPKKNKVGVDSFTYTATDPAGNVSRQATVTVTILKPAQAVAYRDTLGQDCRFEAEWLRSTGLFAGESVGGQLRFQPQEEVTGGQFVAMLLTLLEVPEAKTESLAYPDAPQWLRPYLAAAERSGLLAGVEDSFRPQAPISGAQAAVILQNALDLAVPTSAGEGTWEEQALAALGEEDLVLEAEAALTRGECAKLLYRVSTLPQPQK